MMQRRCAGWTSANQSTARTLLLSTVDLRTLYTKEATHDVEKIRPYEERKRRYSKREMTAELITEIRYPPPPCKTCRNKIIHRVLHNLYCQRTSVRNFNRRRDYWILMEEKDVNLRLAPAEDGSEITIILKNYNERASEKERIKLNKWEVGMQIVAIQMDTRRKLIHFTSCKISKSLEKRRITRASASYVNLLGEGSYGCVYPVETYQRLRTSTNDTDATTETNRDERILKISPPGQNLCK
ncbi:MAG: hypothetical protein GY839_20545 [candidate division Zixibacteria bacterium]|nr:hypothetical protein [candidate division Zixibacteria bacterium]